MHKGFPWRSSFRQKLMPPKMSRNWIKEEVWVRIKMNTFWRSFFIFLCGSVAKNITLYDYFSNVFTLAIRLVGLNQISRPHVPACGRASECVWMRVCVCSFVRDVPHTQLCVQSMWSAARLSWCSVILIVPSPSVNSDVLHPGYIMKLSQFWQLLPGIFSHIVIACPVLNFIFKKLLSTHASLDVQMSN